MIPGPSEPKLNINTYLTPLVDELLILWESGVKLRHGGCLLIPETFKACLFCIACDIPASRKVCGFFGHNSAHGCNKCSKTFVTGGIGDPTDYSGFEPCRLCNIIDHCKQVEDILSCSTQEEQNGAESKYGIRYSELLRLPYFDCIRYTIIDPMHNLFLGTAKHVMESCLEASILTAADLQKVQERVDAVNVPTNMGRIPAKIAKSFSGFTAEQWKEWVTVFSPYALFDLLPSDHYNLWLKFFKACKLICTPMVNLRDFASSQSLLVDFYHGFEKLFGNRRMTPNMHLHTHLADCIFDYGPVCEFWLFSFERYNRILGKYYTNNKSIEIQLMPKFTKDQLISSLKLPDMFQNELQPILDKVHSQDTSLLFVDRQIVLNVLKLMDGGIDVINYLWFNVDCFSFGTPHTIERLDDDELGYLKEVEDILPQCSASVYS